MYSSQGSTALNLRRDGSRAPTGGAPCTCSSQPSSPADRHEGPASAPRRILASHRQGGRCRELPRGRHAAHPPGACDDGVLRGPLRALGVRHLQWFPMTPGALPTSLGMPPSRCSGGLTSFSHRHPRSSRSTSSRRSCPSPWPERSSWPGSGTGIASRRCGRPHPHRGPTRRNVAAAVALLQGGRPRATVGGGRLAEQARCI